MLPGLFSPPPLNVVVRSMPVVATSYCYGSRTATGTVPHPGTAAVDPRVIAMGSYFIINGSIWHAEDTGGDVNGARVDLWSDSCAASWQWGRRPVIAQLLGRAVYTRAVMKRKARKVVDPHTADLSIVDQIAIGVFFACIALGGLGGIALYALGRMIP